MELDKIKKIGRQTYLADGSRKENDAEHSWHLALMAFVLADYANEESGHIKDDEDGAPARRHRD